MFNVEICVGTLATLWRPEWHADPRKHQWQAIIRSIAQSESVAKVGGANPPLHANPAVSDPVVAFPTRQACMKCVRQRSLDSDEMQQPSSR